MRCLRTPPPFLQPLNEKRVSKPVVLYTAPSIHGRGQKLLTTNPQNTNPQNLTAMPQIGIEAEQMQGVESDGMVRSRNVSARSIIVNETTNKNVSQEWDEMDQNLNGNNSNMDRNNLDDFRDVEAGVENFGNFGTGQSGINNRNLIEIVNRNTENSGDIGQPTPLSHFSQAKKSGILDVRKMTEEEIRAHRQQLDPQQLVAFDAGRIIADELWPRAKRKIVQYPPNKQQQPIILQPRQAQVVNSGTNIQQISGANKQQFLASRAKNIFDSGEMGIPQSDKEFIDEIDRNTAAQRAEAEKQQGGNRKNFGKNVDWNNPENRMLFLQKELEVDIMMIDKKI